MMGERLRNVEQGADTAVWLALSRAAARTQSGQFFQGEWGLFNQSFHPPVVGVSERSLLHPARNTVLSGLKTSTWESGNAGESHLRGSLGKPGRTAALKAWVVPSLSYGDEVEANVCVADRRSVPTHLPLAWTHSAAEDIQAFIVQLDALAAAIRSQPDAEPEAHTHPATPETL